MMQKIIFSLFIIFNVFEIQEESNKPNIILLIIDDMGYGDISAHGNPVVKPRRSVNIM